MTLTLPDLYTFAAETRNWDIDLKILPDLLQGLTSLSITSNFLSGHLFQILPHCIKLETLSIDFAGGVLDVWSNDPVTRHALQHGFILPNLRSLLLMNGASFAKLECIRMPRLVELSIATEPSCDCQIGEPSFAAFIRGDLNAESQLRRLSIKQIVFYRNVLFDALKDLASLTHLTLDEVEMENDEFLKLSKLDSSLPRLRVLSLQSMWIERVDEILHLQEFVEERRIELSFSRHPRYKGSD
jgi:hypothetical protein